MKFLYFGHRLSSLRIYPHYLPQYLLDNRYKSKPRLKEMEQISPGVWGRVHKEELEIETNKVRAKMYKVQERVLRLFRYVESKNRATLAGMSADEALSAFSEEAKGCLEWFECLPPGISYQAACDKTGVKFWVGGWSGNVHSGAEYTPHAKKPRKTRMVAKRI